MTSLIKYAGYEPRKERESNRRSTPPASPAKRATRAYDLFRVGRDTADIAAIMRVTEHTVLRWVNQARSEKLGLADPYGDSA